MSDEHLNIFLIKIKYPVQYSDKNVKLSSITLAQMQIQSKQSDVPTVKLKCPHMTCETR